MGQGKTDQNLKSRMQAVYLGLESCSCHRCKWADQQDINPIEWDVIQVHMRAEAD